MGSLHRKPTANNGLIHNITPENADWRYVGFDLYKLSPGQSAKGSTGEREVIIVLVEGRAHLKSSGKDWGVLGDRMSVFEKTSPHCLYLPRDNEWEADASTNCVIAICSAPCKKQYDPRLVGPDNIELTKRGKGVNTRYINI